jgi:hypothetical protein
MRSDELNPEFRNLALVSLCFHSVANACKNNYVLGLIYEVEKNSFYGDHIRLSVRL